MLYLEKSYIGNGDITLWLYKVYQVDLTDYLLTSIQFVMIMCFPLVCNKSTPGIHLTRLDIPWAYCP